MKKLLLAITISLTLSSTALAYNYPTGWNPQAPCGWDFFRSAQAGVPPRFCWAKQDRGDMTFSGKLNVACSGSACKAPNHI